MARLIICAIVFTILAILSDAARILAVYPVPSYSHQIVFRPLTLELIKLGHEVVVITPDPMFEKGKVPEKLTEIDVHNISYTVWQDFMKSSRGNKEDLPSQIELGFRTVSKTVDHQLQVKEIRDLITGNHTFDLLMTEACVNLALGFSHVFKVPLIQVSSLGALYGNYESIGAPTHMFLYPGPINQRIYNLSILEKINKIYDDFKFDYYFNKIEDMENQILLKHFGPSVPSLSELKNNIDMFFLNVNPIWEGNYPVPPGVIHMGGLPDKPDKPLPAELKKYLDSSRNGVVYVSFGTNVNPSQLPPDRIKTILKVLSELPHDVLMKWDKDVLPGRSANIKLMKWLPQSDLLKHPKIKLFITQGGLQSTDEAIIAGVPLIGIPMLGDQWYNVEKYEYHRIGVKLDLVTLTEETLKTAIQTVLGDETYRKNIKKLRELMLDQPMRPLDRAMWWIEYVLRHGGAKHLRSPAANITWAQYLEIELVVLVLTVILTLTFVIALLSYVMYKGILNLVFTQRKLKTL